MPSTVHIEPAIRELKAPPSRIRTFVRAVGWTLAAAYFTFAALVLGLRYWLLPNIGEYRAAIELAASEALGERVAIGGIEAGWHGLRPELTLTHVTLFDRSGREALVLPGIEATLGWRSLVYGSPQFHTLAFDQPNLEVRRDAGGRIYVAGIEVHPSARGDRGLADWLLAQREIVVRNGSITWDDELRGAPRLALSNLAVLLRNGIESHRFALRATTAPELASALDLRGELHGSDLRNPDEWTGRLYVELAYTDLAAWKQWVHYPLEVRSGKGAVRVWAGFARSRVTEATADLALAGVAARLATELPLLQLEYVQGRLSARSRAGAIDIQGRDVSLRTGTGAILPPSSFALHWDEATDRRPMRGSLQATRLQLQPLADVGEYLPLPEAVRTRLAAMQPRGQLDELKVEWTGRIDGAERYRVSGRFAGLEMRAHDGIPGFSSLSGSVDANEKGGTVSLTGENAKVDLAGTLRDGETRWDKLSARLEWKRAAGQLEVRIPSLAVASRDIAGSITGRYATKPGSSGVVDLTASFPQADAAALHRYIPHLADRAYDFLKGAILAGRAQDVRLRIRGDLDQFPFEKPAQGTFQASAKMRDVRLRFSESWPEVREVNGELVFEARGMRIAAAKGSLMGIQLGSVRAAIPDLFGGDEQLRVEAQAEDQTADFLRFIEGSPVAGLIDDATRGVQATGNGRAQVTLDMPLRRIDQTRVSGSYQILNNQLRFEDDVPPLAQVNGRLEFGGNSLSGRGISAQLLGGPAILAVTVREGAYTVTGQGSAVLSALPAGWTGALGRHASGTTTWNAVAAGGRGRPTTLVVDSPLTGVTIDVPAPLGKSASQVMPLHLERAVGPDGTPGKRYETMRASLGRGINATVVRRREGDEYAIDRAAIGFNDQAVMPERPGVSISGSLPYLDADRWRALLGGGDGAAALPVSANLRIAAVDFAGKRIHEVSVRARSQEGAWLAALQSREAAGDLIWRPEGRGRIIARLKHFTVPDNAPGVSPDDSRAREMPALDVTAESLTVRGTELGRLELVAVNESAAADWRIERLQLTNPESTLSATGVWQNWAARPSISVNMKLEVNDVGRYLERIGYPGTVRRGNATMEGKLGWAGSPASVDHPTLTGSLRLTAAKGQFLKAEPGVAKLLGVLSLQSWITLDFRDLFAEGFAFDSLSGSATISKGVLTTEDFVMRGSSATVSMRGQVDLAKETQDLRARVVPALGDGISSVAGVLLANPVVGIGALLAQRLFKDPLGQIFAFEYSVQGTWTDPKVERVRVEPRSLETPAP